MLEEGYLTLFIDIQKLHISNALSLFKGWGGGVWGDLLYQKSQERRYEKLLKGRGDPKKGREILKTCNF